MSIQAWRGGDVRHEQGHPRNVNCADHAAARRNSKMLHEGARIAVRGHNRELAVGGGHGERSHPAWHGLHDVMQHHLADGSET